MLVPTARFLVVDDFEMTRFMLRNCLTEMGYSQIDEAEDGLQAKAMLQKAQAEGKPYAIVFSDLNMPNMDGIGLLKFCRSDDKLKSTPFIMITAEAARDQVVLVLKSGANDYIPKPFSQSTLEKKIQRLVEQMGKAA